MPPAEDSPEQLQEEEATTVGDRSLERYVACESWLIKVSILQPWSSLCADSSVLQEF